MKKMNLKDTILDIEQRCDLLNIQIRGYYFWAYNRCGIYEAFLREEQNQSLAHETLPLRKQIHSYSKKLINYLRWYYQIRNIKNNSEPTTIVIAHSRRVCIDGLWNSIYTDMLIPKDFNVYTFEESFLYSHYQPAASKNLIYLDHLEINSRVKYIYEKYLKKKKFLSIKDAISEKLMPVLDEISNMTNLHVDKERILATCIKHYFIVKENLKCWDNILSKTKVERIIEVIGYSLNSMSINQVAKKYKIPTIEIQHGMLSGIHVAYQYHPLSNPILTPDYIYTFSDYWSSEINIPNCKKVSIGFEYFNTQRLNYPRHKDCNDIIVISQGNVGRQLSEIACELVDYIKRNNLKGNIYYKLHPGEYNSATELYPSLFANDVIKVVRNDTDLYELFARCSIQIGYNSTAVFEGYGFNLKTFLLKNDDPFMIKLVEEHLAQFYSTPDKVFQTYDIDLKNNPCDIIWKDNAKENFIKSIADISSFHKL